jgi:hypothetical protein
LIRLIDTETIFCTLFKDFDATWKHHNGAKMILAGFMEIKETIIKN